MKNKVLKKLTVIMVLSALIVGAWLVINDKRSEEREKVEDVIELTWYQLGEKQKDTDIVLEKVNDYLAGKIGVKLDIVNVEGADYTKKMQVVINTGSKWIFAFQVHGQMIIFRTLIKVHFWHWMSWFRTQRCMKRLIPDSGRRPGTGKNLWCTKRKELGNMQMWVFTKEYVDKYEIPYEELHTLEDLEPWLKVIRKMSQM